MYWTGDSKFVSLSPLLMCWGAMVLNTILMLTALNIHLLLWNLFPEYAHCLFYISIWVTMRHVKLDLAQTEPFITLRCLVFLVFSPSQLISVPQGRNLGTSLNFPISLTSQPPFHPFLQKLRSHSSSFIIINPVWAPFTFLMDYCSSHLLSLPSQFFTLLPSIKVTLLLGQIMWLLCLKPSIAFFLL